jgi:peptidoglycan/xylan/chitin deacetylase (PgdA/CDA1 family)
LTSRNWLRTSGRDHYTPIHLTEWIAWCRHGHPLPEKPVAITFDDGYRDTAEFGFPLLKRYGFKGTLFLVTDQSGGTNIWDLPLGLSEQPLMTLEEVCFWAVNGIEIGSHTRSPILTCVPALPEQLLWIGAKPGGS